MRDQTFCHLVLNLHGRIQRRHRHHRNIRAENLRFSADEVFGFMNDIAGIPLAEAEIAILENRTEGWIAGLQISSVGKL